MNNLELLSDLHAKCFPNKKWTSRDFDALQKSGAEIIMSDNSFIVYRIAGNEAEIITIGVMPDEQRCGIATALTRIMENGLKKKNINKIFLEVAIDNLPAIGLYEKSGFSKVGTRPKYYDGTTDGIIMQKEIL